MPTVSMHLSGSCTALHLLWVGETDRDRAHLFPSCPTQCSQSS